MLNLLHPNLALAPSDPPTGGPADRTPPPGDPPSGEGPDAGPGPVPYDRFKEVNDARARLEQELADLRTTQAARDELYDQREGELKAERAARLRLEVAARKGIPAAVAHRLQGETAEELEQDAERLSAFLKPPEGPGNPPANRGGRPPRFDLGSMSPEEIRQNKREIWDKEVRSGG